MEKPEQINRKIIMLDVADRRLILEFGLNRIKLVMTATVLRLII